MKIGLVLEGGGMRGIYTIGVLDAMMEHGIHVDYVIGNSAGACNGISYVAEQQGRSYRIDKKYLADKRYLSIQNFIKTRSMFGTEFVFHEIPETLEPFDMQTFLNSPMEFRAGVTDMETGKVVYFDKEPCLQDECTILAASCAIPMFAAPVTFRGKRYLDGGTADPIPLKQALKDGCDKLIIVRTRDRSYRKPPEPGHALYSKAFAKSPEMIRCIERRHLVYNHLVDCCERLEDCGQALMIAPKDPVHISRFEKRMDNLEFLYRDGWRDAEECLPDLSAFLGQTFE